VRTYAGIQLESCIAQRSEGAGISRGRRFSGSHPSKMSAVR
jgi:hypothetical protein